MQFGNINAIKALSNRFRRCCTPFGNISNLIQSASPNERFEQIQYPRWIFQQMVNREWKSCFIESMIFSLFNCYWAAHRRNRRDKWRQRAGEKKTVSDVKYSIFGLSIRWSDVCWVNTFVFKFRYRPWNNVSQTDFLHPNKRHQSRWTIANYKCVCDSGICVCGNWFNSKRWIKSTIELLDVIGGWRMSWSASRAVCSFPDTALAGTCFTSSLYAKENNKKFGEASRNKTKIKYINEYSTLEWNALSYFGDETFSIYWMDAFANIFAGMWGLCVCACSELYVHKHRNNMAMSWTLLSSHC